MSGHDGPADDLPTVSAQSDTPTPAPDLSPDQLTVLNIIAEYAVRTRTDITGDELHVEFGGMVDEEKDAVAVAEKLRPRYVDCVASTTREWYQLTAEGWLHSKYADDVRDLVADVLALLREKLVKERKFAGFIWEELAPRLKDGSPITDEFARLVLERLGLVLCVSQDNFLRPPDIRGLTKLRTLDDLVRHREAKRAARQAEEEEKRAAAWQSDGAPDLLDLLSDLGSSSPSSLVVNNKFEMNIHGSTGVAVSQGEGSQAATTTNARESHGSPPDTPSETSGATFDLNVSESQVGSLAVGDQSRAVTVIHQGLTFTEAEKLFGLLFEQNFPKLAETAKAEARRRVDEFAATFTRVAAAQNVTEEQLGVFTEPDVQFMLNSAIQASARRNSRELWELLSRLLLRRLRAPEEELEALALSEAVLAAGKLATNQLHILALCFLTMYAEWFEGPATWGACNAFLQEMAAPFMGTKLAGGDLLHIEYTGCATADRDFGSYFEFTIERRYPGLFGSSYPKELEFISSVIEHESPILTALSDLSKRAAFYALHLSTVGVVLAITVIEQMTGKRLPIDKWLG